MQIYDFDISERKQYNLCKIRKNYLHRGSETWLIIKTLKIGLSSENIHLQKRAIFRTNCAILSHISYDCMQIYDFDISERKQYNLCKI